VRIVVASLPDVLKVPISALVRQGDGWSVFLVNEGGRARQVPVKLGPMNDREAVVKRGLAAGDVVIVHPSDRIVNDVRVKGEDAAS
jgi:HlyD family secretion protein